ncbi:MAG: gliding motility-associated C-terminal domain-containing protein [Taibaiella sp.]|nr:gliding motility-associated C-terminal domain-containing protein [Taibaiella sp.]
MKISLHNSFFLLFLISCFTIKAKAQFPFTAANSIYTQNFNSFNGTFAGLPQYWTILTQASITERGTGCGSDNSGGLWAYYSSSGERALGYLPSGTSDTFVAQVSFVNNTGSAINSLRVSYNFETWRRVASGRTNGFTVTTNIPGANVSSLSHSQAPGTASNCTQIATLKSLVLSNLNIQPGQTFYFRWGGGRGNSSGASNGIGIDNVTIELFCPPKSTTVDTSICFGSSFTDSHGNVYTSSQNFSDTLQTAAGCDSVVHYNLTVLPLITDTIDTIICAGQSLVFNGITYTTSQAGLMDTFVSARGCDSIVTLNLTVMNQLSSTINATICQGQSYLFNGINYTSSQSGIVAHFTAAGGCDSVVTFNLIVTPPITHTINAAICQGQSYTFNGTAYTSAQTGIVASLTTASGCDSIVTFNLSVSPPITNTVNATICQGQSYTFNGITYTGSQTGIIGNFSTPAGCDSIVTLNLTVNGYLTGTQNAVICQGQTYLFNGIAYTGNNNTAQDTVQNAAGCDSIITLNLIVNPSYQHTLNESICQGQSYTFNGNVYTTPQSGVVANLQTVNGCDSIVTFNLAVHPLPTTVLNATICQGQSYTYNGVVYTTPQTGITTFYPVPQGCDSLVIFNLAVLPVNPVTQSESVKGCFEAQYDGMTYYQNATVRDTLFNQNGCDSVYKIVTIEVFNRQPSVRNKDTTGCGELWFNGTRYTQNTVVSDTLKNEIGCDSLIVHTAINIEHIDLVLSAADPQDPYEGEPFRVAVENRGQHAVNVIRWLPEYLFDPYNRLNYQRISLDNPETVVVIATTPGGCLDTASLYIEPRAYNKDIVVPNAFTPNGDGKNDVFIPFVNLDRAYSIIDFKVYNRYGQVIHASANRSHGWDGSFNGKVQDNGVYAYIIRIRFIDGTEQQFKGEVTLIR